MAKTIFQEQNKQYSLPVSSPVYIEFKIKSSIITVIQLKILNEFLLEICISNQVWYPVEKINFLLH